jgi:hypothetical protein
MQSPSTGRRRSGQIPANRRPGPTGRGRRATRGVSWLCRRGRTVAATGVSRGAPCSGGGRGRGKGMGGSESFNRARGGVEWLGGRGGGHKKRVPRRRPWRTGGGLAVALGGTALARTGSSFYRRMVACFVPRRPTASRRGTAAALVGACVPGQGMDRRSTVAWPTGEGRRGTWHGKTSRHLGVLLALGTGGLGKVHRQDRTPRRWAARGAAL